MSNRARPVRTAPMWKHVTPGNSRSSLKRITSMPIHLDTVTRAHADLGEVSAFCKTLAPRSVVSLLFAGSRYVHSR